MKKLKNRVFEAQERLPKTVQNWLMLYGAWIVGSGVEWFLAEEKTKMPRDLDVIIPPQHWQDACKLIDPDLSLTLNAFGGLKVDFPEIEVDVWPMHLEDLFSECIPGGGRHRVLRFRPFAVVGEIESP